MHVSGKFSVDLEAQDDAEAPAGRMLIRKEYFGDLEGSGIGQMISKRTTNGTAAYTAIEEFEGSLNGKKGSFTLVHHGVMSPSGQSLEIYILEGSGGGDLAALSGTMKIEQSDGEHSYLLEFQLD